MTNDPTAHPFFGQNAANAKRILGEVKDIPMGGDQTMANDQGASPNLLARLQEVATVSYLNNEGQPIGPRLLTPEQVQRGLGRARLRLLVNWGLEPEVSICWAEMLDAFLQGVRNGS